MSQLPEDHRERMQRARASLEGLSVGDAFGERFFRDPVTVQESIRRRTMPRAPWRWTDDTAMALSVFETLAAHGEIDADDLCRRFASRYTDDRMRGYGGGAQQLLHAIAMGADWRKVAPALFDGGSYGNGAAMRVAPLGAYFCDDYELAARHAARSAEPTHAHPEGAFGAVAIAVATGFATQTSTVDWSPGAFFDVVLDHVPPSLVRAGIETAGQLPFTMHPVEAGALLGNGSRISAQDTVPYTLWCAARHADSFEEAMWATVSALGDRDTTCAIVGGIVAARLGPDAIPRGWRNAREPLGVIDGDPE